MGLFSIIGQIGGALLGGPMGSALGGALGGALEGNKDRQKANQYNQAQNDLLKQQAALYGLQGDMGRYFFDDYKNNYAPLAIQQLKASQVGLDPQHYADMADANVMRNYQQAVDMGTRNLARNGVNPSDGRWLGMQRDMALDMTGQRVGAQNQARQWVDDTNWNRRNQMMNYGSSLIGAGTNLTSSAAAGAGSAAGNYGDMAYGAGRSAAYNLNGAMGAADAFVNWWNKPPSNGYQPTLGGSWFGNGGTGGGFGATGSGFANWF